MPAKHIRNLFGINLNIANRYVALWVNIDFFRADGQISLLTDGLRNVRTAD